MALKMNCCQRYQVGIPQYLQDSQQWSQKQEMINQQNDQKQFSGFQDLNQNKTTNTQNLKSKYGQQSQFKGEGFKKTEQFFSTNFQDDAHQIQFFKRNNFKNNQQENKQPINKKLIIKIGINNEITIDAEKHKQQKIMNVIKTYVNNNRVSCCLKATNKNNQIICLNKQIEVIWKEIQAENVLECVLICLYDKFKMISSLDSADFSYKQLKLSKGQIQDIQKHISQVREQRLQTYKEIQLKNKKQQFIRPIATYTSNQIYSKMNDEIRKWSRQQGLDFKNINYFNSSSCLIKSLRNLQKSQGLVYRGIRNLLISQKCSTGDIILFRSFTSTSSQLNICNQFVDQKCSILSIQHTTGRKIDNISMRKDQKQVLFLPMTYFYVNKIETEHKINLKIDKVKLTQIPSPEYFNKNIVFYLNQKSPQNFKLLLDLQVISNLQILYFRTEKYQQLFDFSLQEFIEILNFKQIKFKVVIQEEEPSKVQKVIKLIFQKYKIFVDVFVICQGYEINFQKYEGFAEDVNMNQFITICKSFNYLKLKKFCLFKSQQKQSNL